MWGLVEREEYRSKIESDDADSRLNTDILRAVLDKRLPRTNRAGWEPYSMLVWELSKLGMVRRSDLEGLIARRLSAALDEDRKIVEGDHGASTTSTDRDHFFTHTGLLTIMLEKEFGQGFHSIIFDKVEAELKASEMERTRGTRDS